MAENAILLQLFLMKIAIAVTIKHNESISNTKKPGEREKNGLSFKHDIEMKQQQIFRASNPNIVCIDKSGDRNFNFIMFKNSSEAVRNQGSN
ncbi:MAG: hypothetical protein V1903_08460 [Bacteroidota bacterium]